MIYINNYIIDLWEMQGYNKNQQDASLRIEGFIQVHWERVRELSIFEIGMLICFGISWPVSVIKSIRMKSAKGKSLTFLLAIFIGYLFGITHKLVYSRDPVLYLYLLNLMMVGADLILYFINKRRDRENGIA